MSRYPNAELQLMILENEVHDLLGGLCRGSGVTGFASQMGGNGAVDDTQHFTHDSPFTGKQKEQFSRELLMSWKYGD